MKKISKLVIKITTNIYYWVKYGSDAKEYKGLTRGCWYCESLGICRKYK